VPSGGSGTLAVSGGALTFANPTAQDCGGATVSNTDSITVLGTAATDESLTVDQTGGVFGPGATAETGTNALGEIEISVLLGDASDDVTVLGTSGNDAIAAGTNGVSLNGDTDVDVTFGILPAELTFTGNGGVNSLGARGGAGSGSVFAGRVVLNAGDLGDTLLGGLGADELNGGAGNDVLEGREGNDVLVGGGGNDSLSGGSEADTMTGGAGSDTFSGGAGSDMIRADDDEADGTINGGQDADTAYYDLGVDPNPVAVETRIPA
jgi:Ca2+-binding RTX toxin-like protein